MNIPYVVETIEKELNGEQCQVDLVQAGVNQTPVDIYLYNVVIRLEKAKMKYQANIGWISDYLVALRSYLISFQTSVLFSDAIEEKILSLFGLYLNEDKSKIYAVPDIPDFISNKLFVEDAFIDKQTVKGEGSKKYCLRTNAFIERLMGPKYKYFKSLEQKLCVYGAANTPKGYTALISMPTGGGKSLVTQTLGYTDRGLSIVVVPTVSLAIDQERVARENIKVYKPGEIYCYHSGVKNASQIFASLKKKEVRLLFISPEALIRNPIFREIIAEANAQKYLQNIIIDEAHIVVAWGDFFRVDYQCLSPWRKELIKSNPGLRTFLLSATYSDATVENLKDLFAEPHAWIEIRCDSLRKEPRFILNKPASHKEKVNNVIKMVDLLPHPMILYVNSPYEAEIWKKELANKGFLNVKTFTGDTASDDRKRLIDSWVDNEFDLMIATSAFGVGVDKPDVRSVIHLYMPESPDTYYQELGRGGRDGLASLSVMCITQDDIDKAFDHVSKVLTTEKFWGRWWTMYRNPNNQWGGGAIAIAASTKPNYNKSSYFEEGNDADEKWNINVLLLLNRKKQILISGLDIDKDNRFIFTVRILNEAITQETAESYEVFNKIRNEEAEKAVNQFKLIRNAVEKAEKLCWSEMFFETYPLVSEACPGCNCHTNRVNEEQNRFPLLVEITGPEKELEEDMKAFFSSTNEMLIISKGERKSLISKYRPNIVVSTSEEIDEEFMTPGVNYMNFRELGSLLARDNGFFISGLLMALYSEDKETARKEYQITRRYLNRKRYVIHVANEDFEISNGTDKKISDCIDGTVVM